MNVDDKGGKHPFEYEDTARVPATNGLTPSQTVGPFFAYGLTPGAYGYPFEEIHTPKIFAETDRGNSIVIEGKVFDGNGTSVHDAVVEIVQADEAGNYATEPRNDGFTGYGRCGTGANGPEEKGGKTGFVFQTIKLRGLLNHCVTRIYFPDDELSKDPVLQQVPEARRGTLIADKVADGRFRFDIHMQGDSETVFFDV